MSTRIFVDGSVYSPVDPYATAMLVEDGFVRWVGSDSGARSIADESATITELDGALLTPAFARALAPVAGKEAPEILDYLQAYRAAGYHTHTLLAGMEDVPDLVSTLSYYSAEHGTPDIRLILNATGIETDELISAIKALPPPHRRRTRHQGPATGRHLCHTRRGTRSSTGSRRRRTPALHRRIHRLHHRSRCRTRRTRKPPLAAHPPRRSNQHPARPHHRRIPHQTGRSTHQPRPQRLRTRRRRSQQRHRPGTPRTRRGRST